MRARVAFVVALLAAAACGLYGSNDPAGGDAPPDAGNDVQADAPSDADASPTTATFIRGFSKQTRIETSVFTIARPPGTQAGDLLVLFVYWSGPPVVTPFTVGGVGQACGGSGLQLVWATGVASDEDPPSWQIHTSVDQPGQAILLAVANASTSQLVDDSASALVQAGPLALEPVTVQHDADLLVHAFAGYATPTTWTAPPGATTVTTTEGVAVFTSVAARGKTAGVTLQPQPDGCSTGVVLAIAPR